MMNTFQREVLHFFNDEDKDQKKLKGNPLNILSYGILKKNNSMRVLLLLLYMVLLPTRSVSQPSKPSHAEIFIHEDPQVQVKKFPDCRSLTKLINNENTGKVHYGEDMRSCFDPSGFNVAPDFQKWKSYVGSFVGIPSKNDRPYIKEDKEGENNAFMDQPFVKGSVDAAVSFGKIKGHGTFCSKTRYTSTTRGRILNGDGNWLHGHHAGRAGVAHYDDGWVGSQTNIGGQDDWVVLCCSRHGTNRYVNGAKQNDNNVRNGDEKNVFINEGPHSSGELSGWGAAFIVSWNRDLNHDELLKVSSFMIDGTMGPKESLQIVATTNAIQSPSNADNTPTYFTYELIARDFIEKKCTDFSSSCKQTNKHDDSDTCKDNNLQVIIPRSKEHWKSLEERFGESYFQGAMMGVYKPRSGENYVFAKMNSDSMPENGYKALDGGSFWYRDISYSEPNGNYDAKCWLHCWRGCIGNIDAIEFDDNSCNAQSSKYICSDNNEVQTNLFLNPPTGTISVPTAQQSLTDSIIVASDSERIAKTIAPTSIRYNVKVKACNAANQCSSEFTSTTTCYEPRAYLDHNSICRACPAGTLSIENDATSCFVLCVPGTYLNNGACEAMTTSTCPAGQGFSSASAFQPGHKYQLKFAKADDGQCTLCPPGFFKGTAGATMCQLCEIGTFAGPSSGALSCENCVSGKYNDNANGASSCKDCIAGTFGVDEKTTSTEGCLGCYSGQWSSAGANQCTDCIAGYNLKDKTRNPDLHNNINDCEICPKETYNPFPGLGTECFPCISAALPGTTECAGCGPGKYKMPNDDCGNCEAGTFTNDRDLASCIDCPKGFYALEGVGPEEYISCQACSRGTYSVDKKQTSKSSCKKCISGRYSEDFGVSIKDENLVDENNIPLSASVIAASACKACPKGRYSEDIGVEKESLCENCGPGTHGSTIGGASSNASCINCPIGKFSETVGSFGESDTCKDCPSGYFISNDGLTYCLACGPGKFQPTEGQDTCSNCIVSKFAENSKALKCDDCPIGYSTYGKDASSECVQCLPGEYYDKDTTVCIKCEAGQYRDKDDSPLKCTFCMKGQFINRIGAVECQMCLPGKYQDTPGSTSCIACAEETYRAEEAALLFWTLGITSQDITKSIGDLVSQNEWTIFISAQDLTVNAGVTVIQGNSTGTLKEALIGANTKKIIITALSSDVIFNEDVDIVIDSSHTIEFGFIEEAVNTVSAVGTLSTALIGDSTSIVIKSTAGTQFVSTADLVISDTNGKTVILASNIYSADESISVGSSSTIVKSSKLEWTMQIASQDISESTGVTVTQGTGATGTLKIALIGPSTTIVIEADTGNTFVSTSDLAVGSTSIIFPNIHDAKLTNDGSTAAAAALQEKNSRLPGSSCFDCSIGQTTSGGKGASSCSICSAGRYGTKCKLCAIGMYRPVSLSTTVNPNNSPLRCVSCPSGWFQNSPGQANCVECSAGKAQAKSNSSECIPCPSRTTSPNHPGYYGNDVKLSACLECEEGKQATEMGSTRCSTCVAGTYGRHCSGCVPGKYRSPEDLDATRCVDCPAGFYQPKTYQASCLPCSPGRAQNEIGKSECKNCLTGQYAIQLESIECKLCEPGTGTTKISSAFCIDCARGRFAPSNGDGVCRDCLKNQYQHLLGQSQCSQCETPKLSNPGASECFDPALLSTVDFPPPSPPTLSFHPNQPFGITITWNHEHGRVPPEGYYISLSVSRDFGDNIPPIKVEGMDKNSKVVIITNNTAPWLLPGSTYMKVQAYRNDDGVFAAGVSEWSPVSEPWVLARNCDDDEYLDINFTSPSLWSCKNCPEGASCLGPTVWDDVRPYHGYWRVPWNESVFKRCPYKNDCRGYDRTKKLDNQTDKSTDGCILGTVGILCSQCSEGYNRDAATCTQCSEESLGYRIAILLAVSVILITVLASFKTKLKTTWRRYRTAYRDFLRIFAMAITYSQINTSIPTMINVPWPTDFVNFVAIFNVVNIDIFSLIGVSCVGNFNFFLSFLAMCAVTSIIPLWAFVDYTTHKRSSWKSLKKMSKVDKRFEEERALRTLYHIADKDGEGSINHIELSKLLIQLGWQATPKIAHAVMNHFHDDGSKEWTDDYGQLLLTEDEFVKSMMGSKMSKLLEEQKVLRVGSKRHAKTGIITHTKKSQQDSILCNPDHLIQWVNEKLLFSNSLSGATILALLAHTPVSRKVFQFFHCNEVAGRYYLFSDTSVECWSTDWYAFSPIVLVVLFTFTIGLPGFIIFYLLKHRADLYSLDVLKKVGWLYEPYHRGAEFWQIHDVTLKAILTGVLIYIPDTARASVALMIGICACCSLHYFKPHKSYFLFILNQVSFICTTFKYAAALMLRVDHTKFDDGSVESLGWMLIGLDISFFILGFLCFFVALFVLGKKIKKLSKIKNRMRILAKTTTTLERDGGGLRNWSGTKVTPSVPKESKLSRSKTEILL